MILINVLIKRLDVLNFLYMRSFQEAIDPIICQGSPQSRLPLRRYFAVEKVQLISIDQSLKVNNICQRKPRY
jgi:hypothetical protein